MKYKIGDKVRIVSKKRGVNWNNDGMMDKWLGKVMTVSVAGKILGNDVYRMKEDYKMWYWFNEMIEGIADTKTAYPKIVITTDGKTTLARLYDGKRVINRAEAKCHPEDKFDFNIGASLAFSRLAKDAEAPEKKVPEAPKVYNGDVICIESPFRWWTVGKVYEVKDGFITDDEGYKYPAAGEPYRDADDLRHAGCGFNRRHSCLNTFIPLAEMPW